MNGPKNTGKALNTCQCGSWSLVCGDKFLLFSSLVSPSLLFSSLLFLSLLRKFSSLLLVSPLVFSSSSSSPLPLPPLVFVFGFHVQNVFFVLENSSN